MNNINYKCNIICKNNVEKRDNNKQVNYDEYFNRKQNFDSYKKKDNLFKYNKNKFQFKKIKKDIYKYTNYRNI